MSSQSETQNIQSINSSTSSSASKIETDIKRYKCAIVGDAGIGKTVLINRIRTGEFETKYRPTMGVEVSSTGFETSGGNTVLNVWDTAGTEKYKGLGHKYYIADAKVVIIMFDVTSKSTYARVSHYYEMVQEASPDAIVVICGNKVDCKDRKVMPSMITFHRKHKLQYYDISANSLYNVKELFLHIVERLNEKVTK